jgi:hypothetical protein
MVFLNRKSHFFNVDYVNLYCVDELVGHHLSHLSCLLKNVHVIQRRVDGT